ncbi:hypothetical protein COU37_00935 [Candidatus Micrarchaeota archaeon CG10_big_fil_rev_8_21_14_0_10_45_29]|nr:MAG: hypothetical protein COU37_00935 [Candidatus Micrarchaeota archaeon CG10_big_fil_rev_8_21_14_0_10_45_29]
MMPQKYSQQNNSQEQLGMSLIYAAGENDAKEISRLVSLGADVNYYDPKTGHTSLIYAIQTQSLEAVQALIGLEAELCKPDAQGFLPSQYAIGAKIKTGTPESSEIAKAILISMQDLDALDGFGGNSLRYAISIGDDETADFILDLGANPNNAQLSPLPLNAAAAKGNENMVLSLLGHKADPLFMNNAGFTSLSFEPEPKNLKTRQILWQAVYDANTLSADDFFVLLGGSAVSGENFEGTMLNLCNSLYSKKGISPFTYAKQTGRFRAPLGLFLSEKRSSPAQADCDELACLAANAANCLLAIPLEKMQILRLKLEGWNEGHAALLISQGGNDFFIDVSGSIVREVGTQNLQNSLNSIYSGYNASDRGRKGKMKISGIEPCEVAEFMASQLSYFGSRKK